MEAIIVNFRGSKNHQTGNQMIIAVKGIEGKDKASKLIGKDVTWKSPAGKKIKGRIRALHGGKGCLRVLFERGMPGQAVGQKLEIKA